MRKFLTLFVLLMAMSVSAQYWNFGPFYIDGTNVTGVGTGYFNDLNVTNDSTFAADVTAATFTGDGSGLTDVPAIALPYSAKVNEAGGIAKGQAVYISGATGQFPQVSLMHNTNAAMSEFAGLANEAKADSQTIEIIFRGQLSTLDTSDWSDGDSLYVWRDGYLTNSIPTNGVVAHVAYVSYDHAVNGILQVGTHSEDYIATTLGSDIDIRMGDDAGATKVEFENWNDVDVATIDSNGDIWGAGVFSITNIILYGSTVSRALYIDAAGNITNSPVTQTELELLDGVTGTIANQAYVDTEVAGSTNGMNTSAELAAILPDETGSGSIVFSNAPIISDAVLLSSVNIPNGADAPTGVDAEGELFWDTDDDALVGYDGSADVAIPFIQSETFTILEPDEVQPITDSVLLKCFNAESYPNGVTIKDIILTSGTSTSDSFNLEEWSDSAVVATIETVAFSADTRAEDDGTLADAAIAADNYVRVDLPDSPSDLTQVSITLTWTVNSNN